MLLQLRNKSHKGAYPNGIHHKKEGGFALIIALTLMGFLLLLMLSLSAVLQTQTQQMSLAEKEATAKRNAFLAALQALGELQQVAGPDQRATAQASILDTTPDTDELTGVAEPYWTGVWSTEGFGADPFQNPAAIKNGVNGNPGGAMKWLVSTPDANPLTSSRADDDILLLSVSETKSDKRNIYLPAQTIADGANTGKYAWWVSDEGVKASIAMDNPLVRSSTARDANIALLNAPRTAPEFIKNANQNYDLTKLTSLGSIRGADSYALELSKITDFDQLTFALVDSDIETTVAKAILKNRFHDLTQLSLGVLADVREGGLKRNLSAAFSNTDDFATLKSEHGELIFGHRDQEKSFDPKDSRASRGASTSESARKDPGGPPWEQLSSFYKMRQTGASITPQTNEQMGVGPILTMVQVHYHMTLVREPGSPDSKPRYIPRYMVFPAIILWNPYNVSLPAEDYSVYITSAGDTLKYNWTPLIKWTDNSGVENKWPPDPSNPSEILKPFDLPIFRGTNRQTELNKGGMRFNLRASFAPGEARLFLPEKALRQNWADGTGSPLVDASNEEFIIGGYFYSDLTDGVAAADISKVVFEPDNPNLDIPFELTLARGSLNIGAENTQTIGNTLALLGFDLGSESSMASMIQRGPLHVMYGFNHGAITKDSQATDLWKFPTWSVIPRKMPYQSNPEPLWTDLSSDGALGSDASFPIIGFVNQMRWVAPNLHEIAYGGNLHSIVSALASYNPRAVRSDRTPIEHAQHTNEDGRFNSLYLNASINRSSNGPSGANIGPGSNAADWGKFYDSFVGIKLPLGYTDDPNTSLIWKNTLFELPSGPEYFQSVGSLMHASLAPPMPRTNSTPEDFFARNEWNRNNSYPAFPIGNSIAPLAVELEKRSRHQYKTGSNMTADPGSTLYDWSYLLNDYLWDRYFFAEYDNKTLLNPRLIQIAGTNTADIGTLKKAAEVLMVNGAFNVNSTSVDAWKALLAGTVGAKVGDQNYADRAPYLSILNPTAGNADNAGENSAETYAGYRTLSESEIDSLAKAIVIQVKKRGPFTSMAHFVNRVIDDEAFRSNRENQFLKLSGESNMRERAVGALQAALEASNVNSRYETGSNFVSYSQLPHFKQFNRYSGIGSKLYGQPGFVTQANLLSRLGTALSPRSDTFKIRAYGSYVNNQTNAPEAQAWCEMIVQRQPEEINARPNERRFTIVSFRWLSEEDL